MATSALSSSNSTPLSVMYICVGDFFVVSNTPAYEKYSQAKMSQFIPLVRSSAINTATSWSTKTYQGNLYNSVIKLWHQLQVTPTHDGMIR